MSFSKGQSVMYNSKCCTVFREPGKKVFGVTYIGYQLKENNNQDNIYNNIDASQITACNNTMVCNDCWDNFIYTGDNKAASNWISKHLLPYLVDNNNLEWGHNALSTQYYFKSGSQTWTKDKSS